MKNTLPIILVGLIALLFSSCSFETEEEKRIRVKKELTEIVAKKNASDLLDHTIDDKLNMFKSTWEYHGQDINGAIKASYSARNKSDHFTGDMAWLLFPKKLNLYGYMPSRLGELLTSLSKEWNSFSTNPDEAINNIDNDIDDYNDRIANYEGNIIKIKNQESGFIYDSRKERKKAITTNKEWISNDSI